MPRELISFGDWKALQIDIEDARCGDLLFVKNRSQVKLLSHVALCLGNGRFFHASPQARTAVIESTGEFFSQYEQKLSFTKMLAYIDPRNIELRRAHEGMFVE